MGQRYPCPFHTRKQSQSFLMMEPGAHRNPWSQSQNPAKCSGPKPATNRPGINITKTFSPSLTSRNRLSENRHMAKCTCHECRLIAPSKKGCGLHGYQKRMPSCFPFTTPRGCFAGNFTGPESVFVDAIHHSFGTGFKIRGFLFAKENPR